MAQINKEIIIPFLDAYKAYLDSQGQTAQPRLLSNSQEDYKRDIAVKAITALDKDSWTEQEIGTGTIGEHAIKAVQRNFNLIGRFQVSGFSDKVKENPEVSERALFDLFHERKDEECFARLCDIFGKKYDLLSYLYFILDPSRYLPLRSSLFDGIFKKLQINLQTVGRCTWDNYQEYLSTVAAVRDIMKEYYEYQDIDMLDAHSFIWTLRLDVLKTGDMLKTGDDHSGMDHQKKSEVGAVVYHNTYGEGRISKITEEKIFVQFSAGQRIFPKNDAFEKRYIVLI